MTTQIAAIGFSIFVFLVVIDLVRREKLSFKYAAGWLSISVVAVFFAVFDSFLSALSDWFGFELTSNFIFFALLCTFVLLSLLLTVFLYQQDKRNTLIAQKLGALEQEFNANKKDK